VEAVPCDGRLASSPRSWDGGNGGGEMTLPASRKVFMSRPARDEEDRTALE